MLNQRLMRVTVAGTVVSLAALGGCGRSDAGAEAVRSASDKLSLVLAGPNASPIAEKKEAALKEVLSVVQPHLGSESAATAAAANLITARAQMGLGEIRATQAADLERGVGNEVARILALGDVWMVQDARARDAAGYNPAAELETLARQEREIEGKIGAATASRQRAETQVAALEREAEGVLAQAKAKRDQAAQVRAGMSGASATEALALLERATAIAREADALDLRAADIRGRAIAATPAVDAAKRHIDLLISQRESAAKMRRILGEKQEAARTTAADARSAAEAAGTATAAAIKSASDLRSGELAEASGAAVRHFRDATAAARKALQGAAGESKVAAALVAASAQQSTGDVLLVQSRGDQALAGALQFLLASAPGMPGRTSLESLAAEAASRASTSRTEAQEAYRGARDGFQSAGTRAELADRIEKITRILNELSGDAQATSAAPTESAPAATDNPPAIGVLVTPAPAADPGAADAVKAVLAELAAALKRGDALTASGFFAASTPAQEKTMEGLVMPGLSLAALDGALVERFGSTLGEILSASPMGAMLGPGLKNLSVVDAKVDDLQVEVMGDRATASRHGQPLHMLVKLGDRWLIEAPGEGVMAALGPMAGVLKGLGDAADEMLPGVKEGTFKTKEEFLAAFLQKLGPIMQRMAPMPGMPGAPGPRPGGG